MKTKEYNEAVEKLAPVMMKAYDKYFERETHEAFIKGVKDTCFWPQAIATIDALGIEIVSRDSEFEIGDGIYNNNNNRFFATADKFVLDNFENYISYRIIRRNNKPAVYVENIGGKDGTI